MLSRTIKPVSNGVAGALKATKGTRAFSLAALDSSKLTVTERTELKPKPATMDGVAFGSMFTDYMLRCPWDQEAGWHAPAIVPHGPLTLDPASSSLHYALQCFEGMKAYKGAKGEVRLFRPDMNMARMNRSMKRLFLPTFDGAAMQECISELVRKDSDWVPEGDGYSLYIRPTGISTQSTLGVGPSSSAEVFTILSPVGPYYPEGFKPVRLMATSEWTRAWPGGTGNTKIGGNYSPTILPQMTAAERGFAQVLWLYGEDNEFTEVGTMNFFILLKNSDGEVELVTPPLDGSILPGVTRQSVLDLCRGWGEFKVSERKFYMEEFLQATAEGRVIESFGCGTAVVVSPICHVNFGGKGYDIPLNKDDPTAMAGKLTQRLWDTIADIQYGRLESEWSVVL